MMGKELKMIVLYKNPNTLSLPYPEKRMVDVKDNKGIIVLGKDNLPQQIEKEVAQYFKFVPGRNYISASLWKKIVKYNKEDFDNCYSTLLKVFKPEKESKDGIEIGIDEAKIELSELSIQEFQELIECTMEADDLKRYLKFEKTKDRPRKVIIDAIRAQLNQINLADEIISEEK